MDVFSEQRRNDVEKCGNVEDDRDDGEDSGNISTDGESNMNQQSKVRFNIF